MKTLISTLVLLCAVLSSCHERKQLPSYAHTYTVKMFYTDSSIDTIVVNWDSFDGHQDYVIFTLDTGENECEPRLTVKSNWRYKTIAYGVRRYEILRESRVKIND